MNKLMPSDIVREVEDVLQNIHFESGGVGHSYVTAYQILERLSPTTRERLINERGTPGLGAGKYYSAASVVSDAAQMISNIEIVFLETSSLSIKLKDGTDIAPGNPNVGLYRLSRR